MSFFNKAFNDSQKAKIVTTTVNNSKARDKVFLLSCEEADQYFSGDSARQKKGTDYAKARGLYVYSDNGNSWWWLRSPCYSDKHSVHCVRSLGSFSWNYSNRNNDGVLPAMKIKR